MAAVVMAQVADLFFGERIRQGLAALGYRADVREQVSPDDLLAVGPALLLVDLESPQAAWEPLVAAASRYGVPVLAFGPHVAADLHAAARAAGATRTVAKRALTARFAELVRELARGGDAP